MEGSGGIKLTTTADVDGGHGGKDILKNGDAPVQESHHKGKHVIKLLVESNFYQ